MHSYLVCVVVAKEELAVRGSLALHAWMVRLGCLCDTRSLASEAWRDLEQEIARCRDDARARGTCIVAQVPSLRAPRSTADVPVGHALATYSDALLFAEDASVGSDKRVRLIVRKDRYGILPLELVLRDL